MPGVLDNWTGLEREDTALVEFSWGQSFQQPNHLNIFRNYTESLHSWVPPVHSNTVFTVSMMYGQEATQLRHSWLHYNSGGVRPLCGASSSTTHPSPVQSCADCWYNNTKIHLNQSSLVWKPRYVNIIKLKGNHRQWLQCSVQCPALGLPPLYPALSGALQGFTKFYQ